MNRITNMLSQDYTYKMGYFHNYIANCNTISNVTNNKDKNKQNSKRVNTNKNNRRKHFIKQPGFDVQRRYN
jgi:translation initiation factor 2 gamma subunit (eIF-2gamma)